MKEKFVDSILKRPKSALFLFLLVWLAGASGIPKIQQLYSPRVWFDDAHPFVQELDRYERNFQSDKSIGVAYFHPDGIISKERIEVIRKLEDAVYHLPKIVRVASLLSTYDISSDEDEIIIKNVIPDGTITEKEISEIKKMVDSDHFNGDKLLSPDKKVTSIIGTTASTRDPKINNKEIVDKINDLISQIDPLGGEFIVYGSIKANDTFRGIATKDNVLIVPLVFLIIIGLVFYLYRSVSIVVTSLLVMVATISFSLGILGHAGLIYTNLLAAVPGILLSICLADTIHLVEACFKGVENSASPESSVKAGFLKNLVPTLLTSVTTFVGFFSLLFTELKPVYSLGFVSGIGAIIAWVFSYLCLGAVLSIWGDRIIKPRLHVTAKTKNEGLFIEKLVNRIDKGKAAIISAFFLVFALFFWATIQEEVDSDPMSYFSDSVPHKQEIQFLRKHYPYKNTLNFVVDSETHDGIKSPEFMKKLDQLVQYIKKDDSTYSVDSISKDVKDLHRHMQNGAMEYNRIPDSQNTIAELLFLYSVSLPPGSSINEKVSHHYDLTKMTVYWDVSSTADSLRKANEYIAKANELGIKLYASGTYNLYMRIDGLVVSTLLGSFAGAFVLIFFILLLLYRDLKTSFIAILPNLFALLTTGFIVWIRGAYLDIGSAIVAAICLGISVDDTIHFIVRYHENLKENISPRIAVVRTLEQVGTALVFTTVILIMSFLCFTLAGFAPTQNLGIATAATLFFALSADLVLLPAILLISGGKPTISD